MNRKITPNNARRIVKEYCKNKTITTPLLLKWDIDVVFWGIRDTANVGGRHVVFTGERKVLNKARDAMIGLGFKVSRVEKEREPFWYPLIIISW
jgi:hypothetical protein